MTQTPPSGAELHEQVVNTIVADVQDVQDISLVERLHGPVRASLEARAAVLRCALPPRPVSVRGRFEWWRALDGGQARRAALLDHLESLCGHLDGAPALGQDQADPLPAAALEEADGFTGQETARLMADHRRARLLRPT